jgi:hypothetical protein
VRSKETYSVAFIMLIFTVSSLQKLKKKNSNCNRVIYIQGQELLQWMLVMYTGLTELYEMANRMPDLPVGSF